MKRGRARLDATPGVLAKSAVREAARAISLDGAFFFSARNLYYELVRRGAIAPPAGRPREELTAFRRALSAHQAEHGRIAGLISAAEARARVPATDLPDVFDYAVRRVLVFDRLETMLVFARNGFHRKIETALVAWPDFPGHVWRRLLAQVEGGLRTAFYAVHDASARGVRLGGRVRKSVRTHGEARFADVGLTFGQAFTLGLSVREQKDPPRVVAHAKDADAHEKLLLTSGSYAHVEELPPLEMMRWAYSRVARGPQDPGFG